jgi:hypothetical protein
MKITVQNLGTIKEGSISLDKSLTVLVGPNNSGKSYISYLIYGFRADVGKNGYIHDFFKVNDDDIGKDKDGYSYINIKELLIRNCKEVAAYLTKYINENLTNYFSSNKISAKITLPKLEDIMIEEIRSKYQEGTGIDAATEELGYRIKGEHFIYQKVGQYSEAKEFFNGFMPFFFGILMNEIWGNNIHFFPTERLALTMLSNDEVERKSRQQDELRRLLLANKGTSEDEIIKTFLKGKEGLKTNYPQAINDYIYFINDLRDTVQQKGEYADFAEEIEKMLMQGKISVSSFGSINYTPEGQKEPIEIHISSSFVKSLSGLILYFRHLAKEGDTIIIDEPEVNLHPNNQRIIARVMAKAVNKGFKVILSTHSDYIIKELNNLVMLNKANENPEIKKALLADLAKDGYDEDSYLKKEDLGVYFFDNHTIQELEVDDMGFDVATIDTELDKMTYSSEQIYYSLFGQEATE